MKTMMKLSSVLFVLMLLSVFVSCKNSDSANTEINPFDNGRNERNMIVVISDIHLGADLNYAECNKNLPILEKFLKKVQASPDVKELVIGGDLIDEWFIPASIDPYQGKDQADFIQRVAKANKGVVDAINSIIQEKKILVTYVPGNHDLTVTKASIELVFPGINQARDKMQGLGTYTPSGCPQLAIEHGHRYNFFCAPDPISNQDIAPGTIIPPGYFYTRIATQHVVQGNPPAIDTIPTLTANTSGNESQDLLFIYWKLWQQSLLKFTLNNRFDEKMIVTNFNGFTGTYSVNDILPYQKTKGGLIEVNLYNGIQDNWEKRQTLNEVSVHIPAARAIANSALETESDEQAKIQYFLNPNSEKRIVVFGHTHIAKIEISENHSGEKSIYANSGTWIDKNTLSPTSMNFIVITPQNEDKSSETMVKLYSFSNEVVTLIDEASLRF